MGWKWKTGIYTRPLGSTLIDAHLLQLDDGLDTAIIHGCGTSDRTEGRGPDEAGTTSDPS
ncbi:MAG: hypothetical protein MUE73_19270 [Planctomycetes bacterium]|jgi:hypothetical protein|nr:hypothetical protein [Planctomycetota bacterium]